MARLGNPDLASNGSAAIGCDATPLTTISRSCKVKVRVQERGQNTVLYAGTVSGTPYVQDRGQNNGQV